MVQENRTSDERATCVQTVEADSELTVLHSCLHVASHAREHYASARRFTLSPQQLRPRDDSTNLTICVCGFVSFMRGRAAPQVESAGPAQPQLRATRSCGNLVSVIFPVVVGLVEAYPQLNNYLRACFFPSVVDSRG